MCTVTYLPLKNGNFILTSNRDENPKRSTIPPKKYNEKETLMLYPKDSLAGGTWVGISSKKRVVCLLNGGFKKHQRATSYRLSRGAVVKELLATTNAISYIESCNFIDIEPFTIVLVDWDTALATYQLVWDGVEKHFTKLPQKPHIWSSATLYTDEMKQLRKKWFVDWLAKNKNYKQETVINFHKDETKGSSEITLKMKRSYIETVSITAIEKVSEKISIQYIDFLTGKTSTLQMQ